MPKTLTDEQVVQLERVLEYARVNTRMPDPVIKNTSFDPSDAVKQADDIVSRAIEHRAFRKDLAELLPHGRILSLNGWEFKIGRPINPVARMPSQEGDANNGHWHTDDLGVKTWITDDLGVDCASSIDDSEPIRYNNVMDNPKVLPLARDSKPFASYNTSLVIKYYRDILAMTGYKDTPSND